MCGRKHHQSICEQKDKQPDVSSDRVEDCNTGSEAVVSSVSSTVKPKAEGRTTVLLQTVKAWIEGPAGRKLVCCLLDGGSQKLCARGSSENTRITSAE